jgi:hypothetical protein
MDLSCGTYCKKNGPKAQKKIILDLLSKEKETKEVKDGDLNRYLIN